MRKTNSLREELFWCSTANETMMRPKYLEQFVQYDKLRMRSNLLTTNFPRQWKDRKKIYIFRQRSEVATLKKINTHESWCYMQPILSI